MGYNLKNILDIVEICKRKDKDDNFVLICTNNELLKNEIANFFRFDDNFNPEKISISNVSVDLGDEKWNLGHYYGSCYIYYDRIDITNFFTGELEDSNDENPLNVYFIDFKKLQETESNHDHDWIKKIRNNIENSEMFIFRKR